MAKIVILDGYTTNPGDLSWEGLEALGQLTVYERTSPEDTAARAGDAEIVLTNKVLIGKREMDMLPRLRYIGLLSTGCNTVDLDAARERHITVSNVPAYSTESVAQMVFAHLLTVTNRTEYYARRNREGRWADGPDFCYWDMPQTELSGKTFGVIGLGSIGSRVAAIAHAFGMKVLAFTSKQAAALPDYVEKLPLEELLASGDVVSLHCPLTADTRRLINRQTLRLMKPSAILINTGRGPLVDDQAVADALNGRRIAAYCADVLSEEPPRSSNPLLRCEHAYVTPHIAWASQEARRRLIAVATRNVQAFLEGSPMNVVSG